MERHYRILQAMNNRFKCCFSTIVLPFLFYTLLLVNVIGNYATIRLADTVKFPGSLGFTMTSIATLIIAKDTVPTSYKITAISKALVHKLRQTCVRRSLANTFLATCKPLNVTVGSHYVIKQFTIITFVGIMVENTITLLLTF